MDLANNSTLDPSNNVTKSLWCTATKKPVLWDNLVLTTDPHMICTWQDMKKKALQATICLISSMLHTVYMTWDESGESHETSVDRMMCQQYGVQMGKCEACAGPSMVT